MLPALRDENQNPVEEEESLSVDQRLARERARREFPGRVSEGEGWDRYWKRECAGKDSDLVNAEAFASVDRGCSRNRAVDDQRIAEIIRRCSERARGEAA